MDLYKSLLWLEYFNICTLLLQEDILNSFITNQRSIMNEEEEEKEVE